MLQESTKQQQTDISSQGKYLTAPNLSHRNLPRFPCQNCTVVRPPYALFFVPTICCTDCSVQPRNSKQKTEIRLEIRAQNASIFMPKLYALYGSVQYGLPQQKKISTQKLRKNLSRDLCPPSLENMPSLLLTFLSQAYSENLSNSPPDVLSTSSRCLHNILKIKGHDPFPPK
jgi:hypothetical protein